MIRFLNNLKIKPETSAPLQGARPCRARVLFRRHTSLRSVCQGSSLLVAILVMGILMTITIGLSNLIIQEIRQTTDLVAAGKAYYSAEAGIENALLDLREHLPGYEVGCTGENESDFKDQKIDDDLHYRYRICNKGNSYPYFDKDKPVFLTSDMGVTRDVLYEQHPEATYNVLPLNSTVTIPLFVENEDGSIKDVHKFLIQYYVNFDTDDELTLDGYGQLSLKLQDFDILRWKVFGTPSPSNPLTAGKTEVISDYFPAFQGDSATTPVCIGSSIDFDEWQGCKVPVIEFVNEQEDYFAEEDESAFEDVPQSLANVWSIARECYLKDAGEVVAATDIHKGCSIETFVKSHTKNYLTLTNIVHPEIIGINDPDKRAQKANIYYRVIAKDDEDVTSEKVLVRQGADISADGYASSDRVKQSLEVHFKSGSFLPVFNFSLYRTDTEKENIE